MRASSGDPWYGGRVVFVGWLEKEEKEEVQLWHLGGLKLFLYHKMLTI